MTTQYIDPVKTIYVAPAICDLAGSHQTLAHWNHRRLAPSAPTPNWEADLREETRMRWLEGVWVENLREEVAEQAAAAPLDVEGFVTWFEALKHDGPGQGDRLFDWLATRATLDDMKWFLTQEAAGEAGFDAKRRSQWLACGGRAGADRARVA